MPDYLAVRLIVAVTRRAAAEQFLFGQELLMNLQPALEAYIVIIFVRPARSHSSAFRQKKYSPKNNHFGPFVKREK